MGVWDDVEALLFSLAEDNLTATGEVLPALVAFEGDELVFVAFLRSFAKGAYADPIIELLALAMPLGADRLALSLGGRAWSLDDPIPPVTDGVDLRQRTLVLQLVDGAGTELRGWSVLHPFDLVDGAPSWWPPLREGLPEGWVGGALRLAVEHRGELSGSIAEVRRQAERCAALGHDLYFGPAAAATLAPPARGCVPSSRRRSG